MARPPNPLPTSLPWRVFTRQEALRAGVSPERLRRSDIEVLHPGLYSVRDRPIAEVDVVAALTRSTPGVAVIGLSAARMQAMPLPLEHTGWTNGTVVHLAPSTAPTNDVVRWHNYRFGPDELVALTYSHLPRPDEPTMPFSRLVLSTRPRTWRDLAPHLDHARLAAVADHLLRHPTPVFDKGRAQPWCTREQLDAVCNGRYAEKLQRALVDARAGADSPIETLLRLAFRNAGLPEPLLNEPLLTSAGRRLHRPDFQWRAYGVCVEYEGQIHNDPKKVRRDIRRARHVRSAGFHEVRLYADDTHDSCAEAVRIVRTELLARGWVP